MNTTTTKNIIRWFKRTVFAALFAASGSLTAQNSFTVIEKATFTKYLDASGSATLSNADLSTLVNNKKGAFTSGSTITYSCSAARNSFNCDNATKEYKCDITIFGTAVSGSTTYKHEATGEFVVKILDNIKPTVVTKNINVYLDVAGSATISTASIDNGTYDNCTFTLSIDKTSFTCANKGANTVTLTAVDKSGNTSSATATVTVIDNIAPTAVAKNLTVYLNASGSASIVAGDLNNGSADNCGNVSLSINKSTFDCSNKGNNTVTLTVTDGSNNESTATSTVTVIDNIAPTAVAKNITVNLDAAGKATIAASDIDGGSTDNCSVNLSVSKSSFDCSNKGSNTVTLTVTDESNNTSTATATITVVDNIAPTALAKNITVYLDTTGKVTIATGDINNGSSDNCGIASIALDKTTFDCSNKGNNTVLLTVTDGSNNVSTATATVTVADNISPTALAKNITVTLNAAGSATIAASDLNNGSSDNCGNLTLSISKSSFTAANAGSNTVTLTVTDGSNNVSTATSIVTVNTGDNIAPKAYAKNITVYLNASGNATITATDINNKSSDNSGKVFLSIDKSTFTCSNRGTNKVTLTVSDESNNTATATSTVTVVDNMKPVAKAKDITLKFVNGKATISASDVDNGSYDNCGIVSMTIDKTTFKCENEVYEVKLTVKDAAGNTSEAKSYLTATNVEEVEIEANKEYVFYGAISPADRTTMTATTEKCSTCTYEWSNGDKGQTSTYVANGSSSITRTVTVTNAQGCFATETIKIKVYDIRCGTNNEKVSMYKSNNQACVATSAVASQLSNGYKYGVKDTKYCGEDSHESMAQALPTELDVKTNNAFFDNQNRAIHFLMVNDEKVTVEVYSIDGRLLQTAFNETVAANIQYVANIQPPNSNTMCYVVVRSASGFSKSFMMF